MTEYVAGLSAHVGCALVFLVVGPQHAFTLTGTGWLLRTSIVSQGFYLGDFSFYFDI